MSNFYRTRVLLTALLCSAGFAAVALLLEGTPLTRFDARTIAAVQGAETPTLTTVMTVFTWIGTGWPLIVLTAAVGFFLYAALGHRGEVALLIAAVGGSALLNAALKPVFERERPMIYRLAEAPGFSFPSGHSMMAVGLYGALAFILWRHLPGRVGRASLIAGALLFVLGIGVSRVYLGVHYPSDVLAGYLASGAWLAALIGIYGYAAGSLRARSSR